MDLFDFGHEGLVTLRLLLKLRRMRLDGRNLGLNRRLRRRLLNDSSTGGTGCGLGGENTTTIRHIFDICGGRRLRLIQSGSCCS